MRIGYDHTIATGSGIQLHSAPRGLDKEENMTKLNEPIEEIEGLVERLQARDREWQEHCDRWVAQIRETRPDKMTPELEATLRKSIDAEAASELSRLAAALTAIKAEVERLKGGFDFRAHLQRQRDWSGKTFGPGPRTKGVIDHIRKELGEIEADPSDIAEWIDVVILALDGAWRAGHSPDQIIAALTTKQSKNERRNWPDWRTMPEDQAIEHVRTGKTRLRRIAEEEKILDTDTQE